MNTNTTNRQKSRDYPAISLRKAVELARKLYEKDRWSECPALTAAKHLGYAGLNGGSRPVLSALKKYGLVEYIGSADNMRLKLTDLARRMLLPVAEEERTLAVREALVSPAIHAELLVAFPQWDLPSDETLGARLEREFGLQHAAVKPFIADLRESLDYVRGFGAGDERSTEGINDVPKADSRDTASPQHHESSGPSPSGLMKVPMPGSAAFIVFPESMTPTEAKRLLSWLSRVVTPAVEFASDPGLSDEAD